MHPANVTQSLDRVMEVVKGNSSPRVVLVTVTWNIIMTPHKLAGRRSLKRRLIAIVLLALVCVCFTMGVLSMQHNDVYYAGHNDNNNIDDTSFFNAENARVQNGKFILKPRNPNNSPKALNGQYYLMKDSVQKRDPSSFDYNRVGHNLEWGYDELMKRLKIEPKCATSALLLVLITSAPGNSDRRNAIRNSWCSNDAKSSVRSTQQRTQTNQLSWHCIFLIGRDSNAQTNADVLKESQYFSDILYGDYEDSYRNLSFKVLDRITLGTPPLPTEIRT